MSMSLVLVKSFAYRGSAEEWANRYHLTGADPADAAAWHALINAVRDIERVFLSVDVTWVRAYGYNSGSAISAYTLDYSAAGEGVLAGSLALVLSSTKARMPGDCAMLAKWATARRSSLGRTVYARKYYHGVWSNNADSVEPSQRAAALGATALPKLTDASLPGGRVLCLPGAATVAGALAVSPYVTTHTLKRRGKRPAAP